MIVSEPETGAYAAALAEDTAVHEAGHAVVSEILGVQAIGGMFVYVDRHDGVCGQVQSYATPDERASLTLTVAGQAAEKIAGCRKRYNWSKRGAGPLGDSDGDFVRLRAKDEIAAAIAAAEKILRANWLSVELLRDHLLAGIAKSGGCWICHEQIVGVIEYPDSEAGGRRR